jgi:hypothetical protein
MVERQLGVEGQLGFSIMPAALYVNCNLMSRGISEIPEDFRGSISVAA